MNASRRGSDRSFSRRWTRRRRRAARLVRSRRPALLPAVWMEIRLRRARRRQPAGCRPIRPSDLAARRRQRRFRLVRANRLRWQVHLAGWVLGAVPVVLLAGWPWLAAGPGAVEAVILVATLRVVRPAPRGGGGYREGPWGAGDREPRHPLPVAGAGAAAIPVPTEQWSAHLA